MAKYNSGQRPFPAAFLIFALLDPLQAAAVTVLWSRPLRMLEYDATRGKRCLPGNRHCRICVGHRVLTKTPVLSRPNVGSRLVQTGLDFLLSLLFALFVERGLASVSWVVLETGHGLQLSTQSSCARRICS